ncbi:MAG: hypothetical protein OIF34_09135, partial [Porticoccaceae bacterium]|nr:hypothetical protein [Porticoccaceae bacterium]
WGSGQVLDITRQRLDGLGWNYSELPTLADIDRPQDLSRLGAIWPQWRHYQAGLAAAAGC